MVSAQGNNVGLCWVSKPRLQPKESDVQPSTPHRPLSYIVYGNIDMFIINTSSI